VRGRRTVALAAALSLSLLAVGCGTRKPPVTTAAAKVTTTATAAPETAAPVATPPAGPAVGAWVSVPYPARTIARLRALLHNAPNALRMFDAALMRSQGFDLEQPVLLTSDGDSYVFSLGLGQELAESLRKANESEKCSIIDVRGKLRFACGGATKPDDSAARAVPPRQTSADVHAEAGIGVIRDLAKNKLHEDKVSDAIAGLDGMSLDLTLEGTPELRVGWHVDGEQGMGWLNAPVAAPPPAFFQLPEDSELAIFGHAPSAADQAPMKKLVLESVGGKDSECAATTAAERAEIEKLFFTGGSFVGAVGLERAKAEAAAEALGKAPTDKKKLAAARDAVKAWGVFGVDEPSSRWVDGLAALQRLDCAKKGTPKRVVKVNKKLAPRLGLPPGTVEITNVRPADKTDKDSLASRDIMLVAADRASGTERTWIAFAHDEATAVARLRGVLAGPSALASRPGLRSLRDPASAGAFVTAAGLMWLFGDEKTDLQILAASRALLRARDLPTGGRTPIVLRMASSHDGKGKGGETSVRMSLDPAALGDVAALLF